MLVKHHMPAYIKTFRRDVVAFISRCNTPGIHRAENETVAWFDCMVEGRESKGSLRCEALYSQEVCGTAAERERLSCERSGFVRNLSSSLCAQLSFTCGWYDWTMVRVCSIAEGDFLLSN